VSNSGIENQKYGLLTTFEISKANIDPVANANKKH